MDPRPFAGADKVNPSLLRPLERRFAPWILPKFPAWLETYHLTMLTLVWSAGIVVFSNAARGDRRWLWGASVMIALQWFTDHLDGKLGKFRGTGLERWGFYMDHMFDAVFIASIIVGYALLLPERALFDLLLVSAVSAGSIVHTMLVVATTGIFRTTYLRMGPTEARVGIVVLNAYLVHAGFNGMAASLRIGAMIGFAGLALRIYATHRQLWQLERR